MSLNSMTSSYRRTNLPTMSNPVQPAGHFSPCAEVLGHQYTPHAAREFTKKEIDDGLNRYSQRSYASRFVEHPCGSIVEYPETGSSEGEAVLHQFAVDVESAYHPKDNIQYSLGETQGSRDDVKIGRVLPSNEGTDTICKVIYTKCKL